MANFSNRLWRYKTIDKLVLEPGNFYQFRYLNYENDPYPLIYYLNHRNAINFETGHFHKYIQGINFHYIPRQYRMQFAEKWLKYVEKRKITIQSEFMLMWQKMSILYPFLATAYRRYLTYPSRTNIKSRIY